ncbi:MAG: hypothetical protein QN229_03470 [Desulfurococcaceae archaeon TW002]
MSLFWEPKWRRVSLNTDGVVIETCLDTSTNLLLCPVCVRINEVCPEVSGSFRQVVDKPLFFSLTDLVNHLRSHTVSGGTKRIVVKKEEEEESVEEKEED